jgi:hypothetical protein
VQRAYPRPQEIKGYARAAAATDSREADEDLEGANAEAAVPVAVSAAEGSGAPRQARHRARRAGEEADEEDLGGRALDGRMAWATDGLSRCP